MLVGSAAIVTRLEIRPPKSKAKAARIAHSRESRCRKMTTEIAMMETPSSTLPSSPATTT